MRKRGRCRHRQGQSALFEAWSVLLGNSKIPRCSSSCEFFEFTTLSYLMNSTIKFSHSQTSHRPSSILVSFIITKFCSNLETNKKLFFPFFAHIALSVFWIVEPPRSEKKPRKKQSERVRGKIMEKPLFHMENSFYCFSRSHTFSSHEVMKIPCLPVFMVTKYRMG